MGTGSNFSTPVLTASTIFYVQSADNGCTSVSVPVEVIVESCANLINLSIENTVSISPNPSNGTFVITYGLNENQKVELEIIDASGKRIYKRKYLDTEGMVSHQINLKNVSDGMYSIQLKAGNESHSERLILKND